jgi:YfiH family protein
VKKIIEDMVYYRFSLFEQYCPEVNHIVTTRIGGHSKPPYDTLNVAMHVGDDPEDVIRNRDLVCKKLGYTIDSMVAMQQGHGANVKVIDLSFKGRGARRWEEGIEDTDGIITNSRGLVLSTAAADCSMSLFYDPVQRVLALAHCGWSGVIGNIFKNVIATRVEHFGSRRGDILVGIGPTICEKCYEIGEETVRIFEERFPKDKEEIISISRSGGKSLNIVKALNLQLLDEGIKENQIEVSNLCTSCNLKEFYSYRAEGKDTGRTGIFAVLD